VKTAVLGAGLRALQRISDWTVLSAIRSALILTLPLVMLGCFASLVNWFPMDAYAAAMKSAFGPDWRRFGSALYNGTTGIIALFLLLSVGTQLADTHNTRHILTPVNPLIASLTALASLLSLIKPVDGSFLPLSRFGVSGLFIALLTSVISTSIFLRLSSIRRLRLNFTSGTASSAIPPAFHALIPTAITVCVFALAGIVLDMLAGMDIHDAFIILLQSLFSMGSGDFLNGEVFTFSSHLLWFFGIHGAYVLDPGTRGIFEFMMNENIAAFAAGDALPYVASKTFLDIFVFMGGSGATLCLVLALLIFGKSKSQRRLSAISLLPGIFNINEILLFGLPVVLNPLFLIPFITTPIVLAGIAYAAVSMELVPGPHAFVQWSTPIFLNSYLSTQSPAGLGLQLFNLVVGVFLYAPFIRLADQLRESRTAQTMKDLYTRSVQVHTQGCPNLLDRMDESGAMARSLLIDLEEALDTRQNIYMEYQPQITAKSGTVCGTEALFRWKHPQFGPIAAPVAISLAEESGLIHKLGRFALEEACSTQRNWLDAGVTNVYIAVNVSVLQLKPELIPAVLSLLDAHALPRYLIELEVTESSALDPEMPESAILRELHKQGLRLAIDDFGMGHSSLKYLKQFPVDVLKIDGAITREITFNPMCADIVASITKLCRTRDIMTVVEFVENDEQIALLNKQGCDVFQGYYFSKPLPEAQCLEYIKANRAGVSSWRHNHAQDTNFSRM
jgi:lactose/cellobiose-specific phosphotransferase system IIC component